MTIQTKFDIGQRIRIKEISWPGTITQIRKDGKDLWYEVDYWSDMEMKCVTLSENEIEAI